MAKKIPGNQPKNQPKSQPNPPEKPEPFRRIGDWSPAEDKALQDSIAGGLSRRETAERLTAGFGRRFTVDSIGHRLERLRHGGPGRPAMAPLERREAIDQAAAARRQLEDLVNQLREAKARQAFLDAAAGFHAPPVIVSREKKSGIRELVPVVLGSDWHVEENVDPESVANRNEYNLKIADERIRRFFEGIIWNVEHHRASGRIVIRDLVLWLGGDLITGYIHPELIEIAELSPTGAIRWLITRLRNWIATLLDRLKLETLVVVCSHGNHGRTTDKTRIATGAHNSFEWLMYHMLANDFREEKRITFEITASGHQYAEVFDQTLHFHHGDDVRYNGGIGGLGIPLLKAIPSWDLVKPAAVHCLGHHHTFRDYGRAVVNGSLIGYTPYSQSIRCEFEPPQQAMFYIDKKRGKCMVTALWVSDLVEEIRRGVKP